MPVTRLHAINLEDLDLLQLDLSGLAIVSRKKKSGGSSGRCLQPKRKGQMDSRTWDIIRSDLMSMFDAFWHMDSHCFHAINEALLTLLPKKAEAMSLNDYWPISLIHILSKLFSKVLPNRLALMLDSLVHHSQTAFVKGRCIQDNFRFVQSSARLLHARRRPSLLLKIDISRAFHSVSWPFLLEILRRSNFDTIWCDWISTLISMASTRILMNSDYGTWICHAWAYVRVISYRRYCLCS
jgi:hypothetical protein